MPYKTYAHIVRIVVSCMVIAAESTAPLRSQDANRGIPQLLSFQGVLLRKDGTLYHDGTFNITVELFDAETGGNRVYTSTIPVVVVRGVFNVIIGERDSLTGVDFTTQLWVDMKAPDALPFEHRTKLTSAPYAMVANHAVVAGSLSSDAPNVVRSVNGVSGNIAIESGPGVAIQKTDAGIRIDASKMLEMIQLVASDPSVMGITRRASIDTATGEIRTFIEISLKDSALTKKYLSRSEAGRQSSVISYTSDSISIPRYNVDYDGRITSIENVQIPRVPSGFHPNRIMLSDRNGTIVESVELDAGQVLMGRRGSAPTPVRIRAGPGVKIDQSTGNELVLSIDESFAHSSLISGRYTNTTDRYQYETDPIDIRSASPASRDSIGPAARILVTLESTSSITPLTITDRTSTSFKVAFAGGLAPGASISWIILDSE